jgi:hypothetical protein
MSTATCILGFSTGFPQKFAYFLGKTVAIKMHIGFLEISEKVNKNTLQLNAT